MAQSYYALNSGPLSGLSPAQLKRARNDYVFGLTGNMYEPSKNFLGYDSALDGVNLTGNNGGYLQGSKTKALSWDAQGNVVINGKIKFDGEQDLSNVLETIKKMPGQKGDKGDKGISISNITINPTGLLTITMTDKSVQTLQIPIFSGTSGVGIKNAGLANGNLTLTMTDGSSQGPFNIMGPKGPQGPQGLSGKDGVSGLQGLPGKDGVGISNVTINPTGLLTMTMTDKSVQTVQIPISSSTGTFGTFGISGTSSVGIKNASLANGNLTLTMTDGSSQGPFNIMGPQGPQGPQGLSGKDGVPGKDGLPGQQGLPGKDGLQGQQGLIGPIGLPGQQGLPGKDGISISNVTISSSGLLTLTMTDKSVQTVQIPIFSSTGTSGVGIKNASLANGNLTLTMTDGSSQGPFNIQGPQGPPGPQGFASTIPGPPGKDGLQGADGRNGVDGLPGKDGLRGADGRNGVDGLPGKDGLRGADGRNGVDGLPGKDGNNSPFFPKVDAYNQPAIILGDKTVRDSNIYSLSFQGNAETDGTRTGMGVVPNNRKFFADTKGDVLGMHLHADREFGVFSDGWNNLFSVQGGSGNVKTKGTIDAAGFTVAGKPISSSFNGPLANINFTTKWSRSPDSVLNVAEISNDTTDYKELMIIGNRSGGEKGSGPGGINRRVGVWDRLNVHGILGVNGAGIQPIDGADWMRIYGTANNGTAMYNGLAIGADGGRGLTVGDWSNNTPAGNIKATGKIDAAGFTIGGKPIAGETDYIKYTSPSDSPNKSAGWIQDDNTLAWDPKIRGDDPNRKGIIHTDIENDGDANGRFIDYDVPTGVKTAHLFHLPWSNCRYFDIWGRVGSEVEWQFITRVNAFQNVRTDQKLGFHDGAAIVPIPQVNKYNRIRIQGKKGRIHLMGIGWFNGLEASTSNGFVNADNIVGAFAGLNVNGSINVASGQAVNIRDQFHGMSWSNTYDGPALYGYSGGGLGTSRQDGYKEALRWNREGDVNIARNLNVNGAICSGQWCFQQHPNGNLHIHKGNVDDWFMAMTPDKTIHVRRAINNQNNP